MDSSWARRTFAPLRDRRFRLYWTGLSVSQLGNAVSAIALTLGIISATGSAADLGIVLGAAALAELSMTLIGGVWADRLPRQKIMMVADALRAVAQVIVAVELFSGRPNIAHIAVASALAGGALGVYLPAASGIVPATVDREYLQQANALASLARRSAFMLGPVIGTTLVVTVGAGWALLFDALTFAVNLSLLSLLRIPHVPREPSTFVSDLVQGWRAVSSRTWLWANLIVYCIWNLMRCFYFVVGPMVIISGHGGEVGWATIVQGGAIGALAGALIGLNIRPRRPLVVSNLANSLGALPLIMIAVGAPVLVVAVAAGLMSLVLGLGSIWSTTLQQHIPSSEISRVFSYDWMVSVALIPVGMAVAGPVAEVVGERPSLLGAGVAILVASFGVLAIRQVRDLGPRPETKVGQDVVVGGH
ncbi:MULTISPECIES: MFS transporter [unclassified Micromonospora]|uniref:MFS transporter n=1 Tax=unclassified Micromonospora TaxID=2617518 RepID=UPI00189055AF|nr:MULTISPECIES: MFS transporter [unclassified Micromonospora]MBF5028527.1 MFS transporter [Micromonospora sp. ANENR4]MCZ7473000.1 MFS transporter [Micromonospora sp. WMMC273]WBC03681.1 MFS transporter [Micromonospora sp. WMMA1976]